MARRRGPRITTPSITAWPPYCKGAKLVGKQKAEPALRPTDNLLTLYPILLFEFLHLTAALYHYLLPGAGVERVATRAHFHVHFLFGGTSLDDVSAGADDPRLLVGRMDPLFHRFHLKTFGFGGTSRLCIIAQGEPESKL
jgi:hypothetical protein